MITDIINSGTSGTSATSSGNNSISFSIKLKHPCQTGGGDKTKFISLSGDTEFMQSAFSVISRVENTNVAKTGETILAKIENSIMQLKNNVLDTHNIPKLRGAITEDGAFQIEWATEKFRAGILIEPDERDSGWYLVTARDLGDLNYSGSLTPKDEDRIILDLLQYVIKNT